MTPRAYQLLREIQENGLKAAKLRAENQNFFFSRTHNDSWWDLVIGQAVTKLALEKYNGKVPEVVQSYLEEHFEQESRHARMFPITEKNPLALKIADFHKRVLKERGLVEYFACFGLLGERMALADGAFFHAESDPHGTPQGFKDELHHSSWVLVLIMALEPSEEQLIDALHCQEQFMDLFRGEHDAKI